MASLNSAQRRFLEDNLPRTGSWARAADQWPASAYASPGTAKVRQVAAEIKLLTELEKHSGPSNTTSESQPLSATDQTDLDPEIRAIGATTKQPSLSHRAGRVGQFLIIFGMGVATALAWQSYGDDLRGMIANSYPQLGWLAAQAPLAKAAPEIAATVSPEKPEFDAMALSLSAMEQSVDRLHAQFVANQQQMTSDMAKLKQDILDKISSVPRSVASPAHKHVPAAQRPSAQESAGALKVETPGG